MSGILWIMVKCKVLIGKSVKECGVPIKGKFKGTGACGNHQTTTSTHRQSVPARSLKRTSLKQSNLSVVHPGSDSVSTQEEKLVAEVNYSAFLEVDGVKECSPGTLSFETASAALLVKEMRETILDNDGCFDLLALNEKKREFVVSMLVDADMMLGSIESREVRTLLEERLSSADDSQQVLTDIANLVARFNPDIDNGVDSQILEDAVVKIIGFEDVTSGYDSFGKTDPYDDLLDEPFDLGYDDQDWETLDAVDEYADIGW